MFNYRLKELRKSLKLNANDFAKQLEMKISTLYSYENGSAKPSYEFIAKLRKITNVNIDWLFYGEGNMIIEPQNTLEIKYNPLTIKDFGKRINKIRVNADLLSREMAMLLDIKEDRYSDLVVGKKQPTLEEIIKICENFNVTADWLLFGKE